MLWRLPGWVRERIERNLARRNILYPWWIPMTCFVGQLVAVVVALVLRDALWPPQVLTLAVALVLVSPLLHFGLSWWLPWWADGLGAAVAATWLMLTPVDGTIDIAPALLAFTVAEAVARDGIRPGAVVAGVSLALVTVVAITGSVPGYSVHLLEILLAFVVGAMLLWQHRALTAEREARERAWDRATTAERERIAREIHDLVAHSLSVSLLQITGARHALRDVREASGPAETAEAVAEVDAALADAEQVGRRAMGDIRRAVSAMADGGSDRYALPGAGDIAALVRELADAGLAVEYDEQGDPATLPDAAGLGLYRIAQESLAKVVKHGGADPRVRMRLSVTGARTRLRVANPLPNGGRPRPDGLGSGLAGMQARATQLGARLDAGPADGEWVVDVRLAAATRSGFELPCGRTLGRVETA